MVEIWVMNLFLVTCRPAVVHRDIKPENIILEGGYGGRRVLLVDFGGVQDAMAVDANVVGSTIVGTAGYMVRSVAVLAVISLTSPRKLFIFIIKKCMCIGSKYPKNKLFNFEKNFMVRVCVTT